MFNNGAEMDKFDIVRATEKDRERVQQFLQEHYYPFEPINVAMGLENGHSLADEAHLLGCLREGTSLLALAPDESRTLLGVCINGSIFSDENMVEIASTCSCQRYAKFLWFLETVDRCSDFWKVAAVPIALTCEALAVQGSVRGVGVGKALLEHTVKVARDDNFPLLRVDCSSYYSARLAEQIGLECMYSLPYSQYKDEDGNQVLQPPSPHTELKMFIHRFL
ncbi:arylalkylamine N-acetyltransferase-like 2 isoform X5 [Periplaneta americana]|uniref:arylalkylamine N-acetyltransferase-like 2 isoform X5 n=1 Tax=Periplaneta americana TaxID=6978 RepID=UPI0037E76385